MKISKIGRWVKNAPAWFKVGTLATAALASVGILSACSVAVQPSVGQYAFVSGHGALSSQKLTAVYGPGARASVNGGSTIWYVPSNQRNYITAQPGNAADRHNPQQVSTNSKGTDSKVPVFVYSFVSWQLNPAIQNEHDANTVSSIAQRFFKFCQKYGCATQNAQNDNSNSDLSHSSVKGWNNMLAENFPTAIDNATQTAASQFGPNLWNDQTQWHQFGLDIQSTLLQEFRTLAGSGSYNYFCGPGSTETHCTEPLVTVKFIKPSDPGASAAYNQSVNATIQGAAAASRLATAEKLYGPYAHWELAESDLVNQCKPNCPNWVFTQPGTAPGK